MRRNRCFEEKEHFVNCSRVVVLVSEVPTG